MPVSPDLPIINYSSVNTPDPFRRVAKIAFGTGLASVLLQLLLWLQLATIGFQSGALIFGMLFAWPTWLLALIGLACAFFGKRSKTKRRLAIWGLVLSVIGSLDFVGLIILTHYHQIVID
jgi:hypothetical protein